MMRILLILLSLSYIFPLNSVGQEIVRFKKQQMKESVCLYSLEDEKLRKKLPDKMVPMGFEREGTLKWFRDCQQLFQKEFANISDEEYTYLKHIKWYIWMFHDGTCQHNYFYVPDAEETFKHVKDLEIHLANLVEQMDSLRFQPDQIRLSDPRNKSINMADTMVPLFYLRKKIDDK